ncbi:PEP-CTERM sorting domain-containing protein [Methyloversatilis universalis]|uniref:PEP-CTERM sorting domain-containing protein n=1 Tax=Methyloversatilis universalis TaxID=378211 RepID=UPI001E3E71FB|nr:PEP-CTERM sorting domain-containing protein [Methyloversatilis universalis]
MTAKMSLALLVAANLFVHGAANANVTYHYTSNNLEPWVGFDSGQPYSPLTLSLDFSDDGSTLENWSAYQEQIGAITKADTLGLGYGLTPHLYLTTDSVGQVTSWYVSVYTSYDTDGSSGAYKQSVLSYSGQILGQPVSSGAPSAWDHVALISPLPERNFLFIAHTLRNPGTWSSTGSIANLNYQSATPVPEPEAYAMLLIGTVFIGMWTRRKNQPAKGSG